MIRSHRPLEAGRLSDAQSEADAVLSMTDWRERNSVADFTINFVLRRVAQYTGDSDALRRSQAAAAQMARDEVPSVRRPGRWLAAIDADAAGDLCTALEHLSEGVEVYGTLGDTFTMDPAEEPLFARIASRAGRPDLAERAADYTEQRSASNPDQPFLAAIARHTRGLVDDDPDALAEAVDLFAGTQRPLPRAAALEDAGRVSAARDTAVGLLDQANDIYSSTGALRDAARVRQRLRTLGVRRGRPGSHASADKLADLTQSELAVVELVARGGTNRQVAEQLFLSPHTVNSHLRHAFSKLGIRSRIELARLAPLVERGEGI
jgi:DNA-binding NarL/FixJ family response regulator